MTPESARKLELGVMAAAVLICCWGIWSVPILNHNEARRMVVVQEMLNHGNWLIPTINGETYLAKPPLVYWLMALSCTLFNTQAEWAMRLPASLMAVTLITLFLHRVGRYLGQVPALFGGVMLLTSLDFIEYARTAQIEMPLALAGSLAMFWFLDYLKTQKPSRLYLSYAALGTAILIKGPVALLFMVPPALVYWLVGRDPAVLRALSSLKGWLIAMSIALPWFLYLFWGHRELLDHVINEDIAAKVAGSSKSSPLYTYPLFLTGSFAPWVLLLANRPKARWRTMLAHPEQRYFLLFSLVPVLLMSLVAEKHGKYLLPIYPALAAMLGWWCEAWYRESVASSAKARRWLFSGVGILLVSQFLFQVVITPRLYSYRFSSLKPLALAIERQAKGRPVYFLDQATIQLVYYVGQPMPVKTTAEIEGLVRAKQSFLVVAESKTKKGGVGDLPLCRLGEFSPFIKKDRSAWLLGSGDLCGATPP